MNRAPIYEALLFMWIGTSPSMRAAVSATSLYLMRAGGDYDLRAVSLIRPSGLAAQKRVYGPLQAGGSAATNPDGGTRVHATKARNIRTDQDFKVLCGLIGVKLSGSPHSAMTHPEST